jgi:hypothetical protein
VDRIAIQWLEETGARRGPDRLIANISNGETAGSRVGRPAPRISHPRQRFSTIPEADATNELPNPLNFERAISASLASGLPLVAGSAESSRRFLDGARFDGSLQISSRRVR